MSNPEVGADFNGDGKTDLVELVGFTSSFHTIPGAAAPSLDIRFDSNPVIGNSGSANVTLDIPAPEAEDVTLYASDPTIILPPSMHFDVGQQVQHFAFTLGNGFTPNRVIALYAQLNGETATAYGTKPNPNTAPGVKASLDFGNIPLHTITPNGSLPLILQLQSCGGTVGFIRPFNVEPAGRRFLRV